MDNIEELNNIIKKSAELYGIEQVSNEKLVDGILKPNGYSTFTTELLDRFLRDLISQSQTITVSGSKPAITRNNKYSNIKY